MKLVTKHVTTKLEMRWATGELVFLNKIEEMMIRSLNGKSIECIAIEPQFQKILDKRTAKLKGASYIGGDLILIVARRY